MKDRLQSRIDKLYKDTVGYKLNPDKEFVADLVEGMLANYDRYGIESCPCRLFEGEMNDNIDIICPCVYRDDDLAEYGACYCALYVNEDKQSKQVPDRRPELHIRRQSISQDNTHKLSQLPYPVYRCTVCGYLMANTHPPHICPICKASKERFERFI